MKFLHGIEIPLKIDSGHDTLSTLGFRKAFPTPPLPSVAVDVGNVTRNPKFVIIIGLMGFNAFIQVHFVTFLQGPNPS